MIPEKTSQMQTEEALDLFRAREVFRSDQKLNGRKVEPRVLLTLVGKGQNRHLEAREDTVFERVKTLFFRKDYKLEEIQTFLEPSTHSAKEIIASKITNRDHNPKKNIIQRIFEAIIARGEKNESTPQKPTNTQSKSEIVPPKEDADEVTTLIEMLTNIKISNREELVPYQAQLEQLEKQYPKRSEDIQVAKQIVTEIAHSLQNVQVDAPPANATYGIVNPGLNACFLNATLQGLGRSPVFLNLLHERQKELTTLLEEVFKREDLAQDIDYFADDIYDLSKQNLDDSDDYLQGNRLNDEGKLFVQLVIVTKLCEIYEQIQSNTIDLDTIQTLRSLIIATGFRERDTSLYSQEDAGMLCMHLLDSIGIQPFTYKMNIAYPASFPIPALDRQGDVANIYPIQLANAKAGASIQDLVRDTIVEEEVDKKAIIDSKQILTRKQKEQIKALPKESTITTLQSIAFPKGKEPKMLPLWLKRYTATGEKITTKITPSYSLDFPLAGKNDQMARYRLVAVAVHEGTTLKKGHFYTYAPVVDTQDQASWVCYNDSSVTASPNKTSFDAVAEKGYIYYYEFVEYVKIGTPTPNIDLAKD